MGDIKNPKQLNKSDETAVWSQPAKWRPPCMCHCGDRPQC